MHHQDGNPSNNKVMNLEYVTQARNNQFSYALNPARTYIHSKPVMCRLAGSTDWTTFPSINAAARLIGIGWGTAAKYCEACKTVGGTEFKFPELAEPRLLPSETWVPMVNPVTGSEVTGRTVSFCGRITSCRGLISRGSQTASGYFKTHIQGRYFRVHRLVAFAFLGPPPSPQHTQVNHKDYNKGNNCLDNLEYVTPSENLLHSYKGTRRTSAEALSKPVLGRMAGSEDEWTRYPSIACAAKTLVLHRSCVRACLRGHQKQTGGYEFLPAGTMVPELLPGEEWRVVDLQGLVDEKERRLKVL